MTLEAVYFISQIVAAVAVFGSLIFVGLQVRQSTEQAKKNEEALRAASAYEVFKHQSIQNHELSRDQNLLALVARGQASADIASDFSATEYLQYKHLALGIIQGLIGSSLLYKAGSLEYEAYAPARRWMLDQMENPSFRQIFEEVKAEGHFFPESYLDELGDLDSALNDEAAE